MEAPVIYKINTNQLRLDAMAEALGEPLGNPLYLNEERGRDYFIAQFDVLVDKHQMRKDYVDDLEKVTVKLEQQIADLEDKLKKKDKKIIMQTMMLRKKQHNKKPKNQWGAKKAYFKKWARSLFNINLEHWWFLSNNFYYHLKIAVFLISGHR